MKERASVGLNNKQYNVIRATGTHFPSHIHNVYEVLRVTKGCSTAVVDGKEYRLEAGKCLVVFPLQYHSYAVDRDSKIEICIFSPHFIGEFEEQVAGKRPVSPCFDGKGLPSSPAKTSNILSTKAFFYTLCHRILSHLQFDALDADHSNPSLLDRLFLFVDHNYDGDCSLSAAAAFLKYDYTYLSKLFKGKTGMSYNEYVSRFRIGKATYELLGGERSISEIALLVGFDSIRTFNWEFKRILGTTPREYRKGLSQ